MVIKENLYRKKHIEIVALIAAFFVMPQFAASVYAVTSGMSFI